MKEPLDELYPDASVEVLAIIARLRSLVRAALPEATEVFTHGALGYGPTTSGFDRIIYLAAQRGYANLGFFYGASLTDPAHLLEGSGKRMRHVKVRSVQAADNPALAHLVREAWITGLSVALAHAPACGRART